MTQIRFKTKTPSDIRRTLTRVMNMAANGQMDTKTANMVIVGCNAVLSSIRADDQQRKIEELEKILNNLQRQGGNMTNEQLVLLIKDGIDVSENMLQLWEQNRGFIGKTAFSYRGYEDMEDLIQQGYIGLCQAVEGYKLGEDVPFINYAAFWIRQSMARYIENCGSVVRIPTHEKQSQREYKKLIRGFKAQTGREPTDWEACRCMGISRKALESIKDNARMGQIGSLDSYVSEDGDMTVGELVPGDVEGSVLDEIEQEELRLVLWPMVDALPGAQPQVIRSRYQEGKTLKAVGEVIGVSCKRVNAIEQEALRELRKRGCRVLAAFLPEAAEAMAYRHNGVGEFNRTWTSSTELVAMKMY